MLVLLVGLSVGVPLLVLLALIATSAMAAASWFLIEKPALGAKH